MKSRIVVITSIILVCCILFTTPISANPYGYLGSDDDVTGYIVEAEEQCAPRAIGGGFSEIIVPPDGLPVIFSITAQEVTDLLPSRVGNKSFTLSSLPSYARKIVLGIKLNHSLKGDSYHSPYLDERVTAGVCYYGYSAQYQGNVYISVYKTWVPYEKLGESYLVEFLVDDVLDAGVTYYSFIGNEYHMGYAYGTLTLYHSSDVS